jgi:hypothetical protein
VVSAAEMAADPQFRVRGTVVEDADGGLHLGPLLRLPGVVTGPPPPPPASGQHQGARFTVGTDAVPGP